MPHLYKKPVKKSTVGQVIEQENNEAKNLSKDIYR